MFSKFLGEKPERLGIVSTLYDQYTATHLTEALMNSYTLERGKKGMTSINSFLIEWNLKTEQIHRVPILKIDGEEAVTNVGAAASEIIFFFPENWYSKNDVFVVENTREQFFVTNRPRRITDNCWCVTAVINDNNWDSVLMKAPSAYAGLATRFVTNIQPEFLSEGHVRFQSNVEKMRTYMSTYKADVDASERYTALEDVFIQIGKGDKDDPVYKLNTAQQDCLDSFMEARNNGLLWQKGNVDENGKSKLTMEDGRPIIAGDGVIPQIERFATKFVFSKMNMRYFERAIQTMVAKSEKATGNDFVVLCNTMFYQQWQSAMGSWIRDHKTDGAYLYSKAANGKVSLGATYDAYTYAGNSISVKLDRSLDVEFPTRAYGMILDLTSDASTGKPAMAFYTFKNGSLIQNRVNGLGGSTGLASGEVSSLRGGWHLTYWGLERA